jgi:hypothetical protein
MNKILPILLLICTLISAQEKTAHISVNKEKHDFGKAIEGETLNYDFILSNTGNGDLILKTVRASCGCTAVQPDKLELKPGESTKLHVEFNTTEREGEQQKYIFIYSNDPSKKELRLAVAANVLSRYSAEVNNMKYGKLKLEKNKYDFGNVQEGKFYIANIKLSNDGEGDLIIKNVSTTCGCTAALVQDLNVKPGKSTILKIELDTSGREGKFVRVVNVQTNDRLQPMQTVTIFANIKMKKK